MGSQESEARQRHGWQWQALASCLVLALAASCGTDQTSGGDGWVVENDDPSPQGRDATSPHESDAMSPRGPGPWIDQFGTAGDDTLDDAAVTQSAVYLVGTTSRGLAGQANIGKRDIYIRKYTIDGERQWTRVFGTVENESPSAVVANSGNVYVVGWSGGALGEQLTDDPSNFFMRAYDLNGELQWTRQITTVEDAVYRGTDFVTDAAAHKDDIYLQGGRRTSFRGRSHTVGVLNRYSADGDLVWGNNLSLTTGKSISPRGMWVTDEGLYVAGSTPSNMSSELLDYNSFLLEVSHPGDVVSSSFFDMSIESGPDGADSVVADDDGIYVAGSANDLRSESSHSYFRKISRAGDGGWSRFVEGPIRHLTAVGGLIGSACRGYREGDSARDDIELCTHDTLGELRASCSFGTRGDDEVTTLEISEGRAYLLGRTTGAFAGHSNQGGTDVFVASWPIVAPRLFAEGRCPDFAADN